MSKYSLININLGELPKVAITLIEKISGAIAGYAKPWQIERVAKAEAKADLIRAETQIEISDRQRRALVRFFNEEAKKQANIEEITEKAIPLLNEDASPQDMEDDWITNFFDKCRIVSDEDMQRLWARILASEANAPGFFSRQTVNLLSDLDKRDAELFTSLCGFCWTVEELVPIVYDDNNEIYNRHGIDFEALAHLESLGFIKHNIFGGPLVGGFTRGPIPRRLAVSYYGKVVELTFPKEDDNYLDTGKVILTRSGQELVPVCGSKPVDGFYDFIYNRWVRKSLVPTSEAEQSDT